MKTRNEKHHFIVSKHKKQTSYPIYRAIMLFKYIDGVMWMGCLSSGSLVD